MGVYRCNHCKQLGEHPAQESAVCQKCGQPVIVYDTVYFINQLINRYAAVMRELNALKEQESEQVSNSANEATQSSDTNPLYGIKLSDTEVLSTSQQHLGLAQWFADKQTTPNFDYSAVDMSGYYDEAAERIGQYYNVFKDIIGRIAWSYRNSHSGLNLDLKKYSQKDAQQINTLCREFYSNTLFSRYSYQKQDKLIHLKLQSAAPVRQFFSGEWLEWYALGQILKEAKQRGKTYSFSCARSLEIRFANEDLHELDVVFLPTGKQPLVIECKTGEYRRDLDKYLTLRKRLNIPAENFILLVTDIDEAQAKAFSSMYELTFLTLPMLPDHIKVLM